MRDIYASVGIAVSNFIENNYCWVHKCMKLKTKTSRILGSHKSSYKEYPEDNVIWDKNKMIS
jgi:hypothetical protein